VGAPHREQARRQADPNTEVATLRTPKTKLHLPLRKEETDRLIRTMPATSRHEQKVLEHRRDYFGRLGFVDTAQEMLAHSAIDPHRTEDLLAAGCSHINAVRILMGTDALGNDDQGWAHVQIEDEGDLDEAA